MFADTIFFLVCVILTFLNIGDKLENMTILVENTNVLILK